MCGRIYFVENCGNTLQYHLDKLNLSNRLLVAKELLKLAIELTDGTAHPNYSFYLTDITADNVAIQLDETSGLLVSLKIIDWSDVIVIVNDNMIKNDDSKYKLKIKSTKYYVFFHDKFLICFFHFSLNFFLVMIHVSEHLDCGQGCLTYSKENICQADLSDHNVYAVCKVSFNLGMHGFFLLLEICRLICSLSASLFNHI